MNFLLSSYVGTQKVSNIEEFAILDFFGGGIRNDQFVSSFLGRRKKDAGQHTLVTISTGNKQRGGDNGSSGEGRSG